MAPHLAPQRCVLSGPQAFQPTRPSRDGDGCGGAGPGRRPWTEPQRGSIAGQVALIDRGRCGAAKPAGHDREPRARRAEPATAWRPAGSPGADAVAILDLHRRDFRRLRRLAQAVALLRSQQPSTWENAPRPTVELVRADAIAAVTAAVWRQAARPEYLHGIEHVRFLRMGPVVRGGHACPSPSRPRAGTADRARPADPAGCIAARTYASWPGSPRRPGRPYPAHR